MNLTGITYMEISEKKTTLFFYRGKNEKPHAEIVEDPFCISRKKCSAFVFCFKNHEVELKGEPEINVFDIFL